MVEQAKKNPLAINKIKALVRKALRTGSHDGRQAPWPGTPQNSRRKILS
jgi:hypothetical protein